MSIRAVSLTIILLFGTSSVHAEQADSKTKKEKKRRDPTKLSLSYLYDGGAIPFVYGTLALRGALDLWAPTRTTPLLFDKNEGGAISKIDHELPVWVVQLGSVGLIAGLSVIPDKSRWFHVKGMTQSLMTTFAMTGLTKHTFGRHRPDYIEGEGPVTQRRSFISGHSASTLSATTYFALYLRYHGFDRARGQSLVSPLEVGAYLALLGTAVYVPYSRVAHNRHHVTDVIAGSVLGSLSSVAFFYWQEARYKRTRFGQKDSSTRLHVLPDIKNRGLTLIRNW